jgi:putative ABC transport system ATP-binding protein
MLEPNHHPAHQNKELHKHSSGNHHEQLIEVVYVCKSVRDASGDLTILHDISLSVAPGETLAIVGASGSGKSTLLSIMAGLDAPSSGEVWLGGTDISALDEDERARVRASYIGFVFQNFQLIDHLTALENVMLPLELLGGELVPQARSKAQEMLSRVGLAKRMNHYPRYMSGGEQQRVALARAFVVNPKILMADEPTGSLDHATGALVLDLIFEMNKEYQTALVLVTHDNALARRCSRRVVIEAGRLKLEDHA